MMKDVPLWVRWVAALVPIIAVLASALMAYGALVNRVETLEREEVEEVQRSEYVALCTEMEAIKEFLNYQHGWPIHPIDCEA